jgi:GH35 family endo-1,4-beta-xylanase
MKKTSGILSTILSIIVIGSIIMLFSVRCSGNKSSEKNKASFSDTTIKAFADKAGILIGVRAFLKDSVQKAIVESEFNTATRTCYPGEINRAKDTIKIDDFNAGINWLFDRGMKPMHHMLFGPSQYEAKWVRKMISPEELESLMEERIRIIMEANGNAGKVFVWNVVNESLDWNRENAGKYFGEDMVVWTRMGFEEDKSGLTGEEKMNDRHPVYIRKAFEYAAKYAKGKLELRDNGCEKPGKKALAFFQLAKHLQNSGVKLDGVGLQCHFNIEGEGVMDTQGLATEIRKYRGIGLEVYFTEVDFGSKELQWTPELAQKQKEEYKKIIKVALDEGVSQVHFWGLKDADEKWRGKENPLLFDENLKPKPAYYGVKEALKEFVDKKRILTGKE